MSSTDWTHEADFTENQLIEEVRTALANLDDAKIPDATIVQQYKRFVLPELQSWFENDTPEQYHIDAISVTYTAEKAFKSWFVKQQQMFGDVQVSVNVTSYKEQLESRTDEALSAAGVERDMEGTGVEFVKRTDGMFR